MLTRAFGDAVVHWRTPGSYLGPSTEDAAVFLGRSTARRTRTLVRGVNALPPGHHVEREGTGSWRLVRDACITQGPRWHGVAPAEIAAVVRARLQASVRALAERSARVGLLLSGGLDSTILAVLLARLGVDLVGYVVEHESRAGPKEWRYASLVAESLKIPLRRVVVGPRDVIRVSDALRAVRPHPNVCWVTVNHHLAARRAADDGRQVLVIGLGSDEIFGGYHKLGRYAWRFTKDADRRDAADPWSVLVGEPSAARTRLLYVGQACPFPARLLARLFPNIDVRGALEDDVVQLFRELGAQPERPDICALMLELEMELRTSDVLVEELRAASELAGIPTAFPFLAPDLVTAAANVPIALKYCHDATDLRHPPRTRAVDKYILRRAFDGLVPPLVLTRPRMTYTLPFAVWLRDPEILRAVHAATKRADIWRALGARPAVVREVLGARLDGDPWGAPFRIWMLYQLATWWESNGGRRLHDAARVLH